MKVLLTSVCRPLGGPHDAPTVGYELLHRQVTLAQGEFSPRAVHHTFALDYIAANLDAPAVVLHYPTRRELIRELRSGPDFVGISFVVPTFRHMTEVVKLVREHAPRARIVLGGYGTALGEEALRPWADHVCREEGVAFFRALLGEPPRAMPYDHPLVVSRLKVLSAHAGNTGMIFAGLGCPHGCDFCATSSFFARRHTRLLPTGDDVFRVIERYLEIDPRMSFTILDEDFLVAPERARRLRELVLRRGHPLSIFAFATIRALSRISPRELLETGIDGVWIGWEGKRAGLAKQQGRPAHEILPELRSHGVTVLASMILGFDYQSADVIRAERDELLALEPTLTQFLIRSPLPGTPFHQRVVAEGGLLPEFAAHPERHWRAADGFTALLRHPLMGSAELEALQRECFEVDFRRLGPSVVRTLGVWLAGYLRHRDSDSPYLRAKARRWAEEIRRAWPLLAAARNGPAPGRAARLERDIREALGPPSLARRALAVAAPAAAAWTRFTLARDRLQHPRLVRRRYRAGPWALRTGELGSLRLRVERAIRALRVELEGALDGASARGLARAIVAYLGATDGRVEVVVARGTAAEARHLARLGRALAAVRHRVSVALPATPGPWALLAAWLEVRAAG